MFEIVSKIAYNNFEILLVVFMPNITTNHAITFTNTIGWRKLSRLNLKWWNFLLCWQYACLLNTIVLIPIINTS